MPCHERNLPSYLDQNGFNTKVSCNHLHELRNQLHCLDPLRLEVIGIVPPWMKNMNQLLLTDSRCQWCALETKAHFHSLNLIVKNIMSGEHNEVSDWFIGRVSQHSLKHLIESLIYKTNSFKSFLHVRRVCYTIRNQVCSTHNDLKLPQRDYMSSPYTPFLQQVKVITNVICISP